MQNTLECTDGACTVDYTPVKPAAIPRLPKITLSLSIDKNGSDDPIEAIGPTSFYSFLSFLCSAPEENFVAIHLNARHEVIGLHEVSRGTLSASLVHPREVFKAAVLSNAFSILIAHNHPSGAYPAPSSEDIKVTKQLIAAGELLGVKVIDHLIVSPTPGEFYCFREDMPELWTQSEDR